MLLYNTLSKRIERFRAAEKGKVRLYTCGPTVHDFAHIGNFRTFLIQDVLKRWLEFKGYKVIHVMNITDIDEKTIEKAKRKKTALNELTEKYTKAFFEDAKVLNIEKADFYPLTSSHAGEMKELAEKLVEKGFAFRENSDIYFDVAKFTGYGKLSGKKPRDLKKKSKKEDYYEPLNFALWLGEDAFSSEGRPSWHIECSALALKYFDDGLDTRNTLLDIHSGGEDLIFPHHENEIAVCEALTGKKYAGYWFHIKHLNVEGKKMSKSSGNYYTVRELLKKGFSPCAIRLALISTHYRNALNFSMEKLREADENVRTLIHLAKAMRKSEHNKKHQNKLKKSLAKLKQNFTSAMDNDLNTEKAVKVFFDFVYFLKKELEKGKVNREEIKKAEKEIREITGVLGICQGLRKSSRS